MPRLILFAPCTKAILDKVDNSMSLIGIFHGLEFHLSEELPEPIPDNTFVQFAWGAGSIWFRLPEDEGKTYEQIVEIVAPNDKRFRSSNSTQFKMAHRTHHIAISGQGFPVGVTGEYKIVLSLREVGQEEWHVINEYPVEVKYIEREETVNEQAQSGPE